MPVLADGRPAEVIENTMGLVSRTNVNQIFETALGKIAAITGKPYKIQDFESIDDLAEFVTAEAKKYNIQPYEHVIDPETQRKIPNVLTGNRFYMKLHHTASSKGQSRSGGGYTMAGEPARGGDSGSKRIGVLESNAIISHSAPAVLRDASLVRGQRNDDWWLSFMQGNTPATPKVPMVYEKFLNELKGSGINVVPSGRNLNIMALTDKDIDILAEKREVQNGETVQFDKGMRPITGGLFDPALTGAHDGNRWAKITLHEPMLNPVFEEPARRLLGLTEEKFRNVLAGRESIAAGTGPEGVKKALSGINLDHEITHTRAAIAGTKKTARDAAIRKLGYLKSCQSTGIHPGDWVLSAVPVLPPKFRPVSVMQGSGTPLVSDANYLYRELIAANDNLRSLKGQVSDVGDERLALYDSFKAVTGLADPTHPKLVEKGVKGLLKGIFGDSPKYSTMQSKLLSTNTDLVGRAVIAPDPDIDMDHIGLPENRAWELYKHFVVRSLKRRGLPMLEAARHFRDKTPLARSELVGAMNERPVLVSRAPVLHRFGIMAFRPHMVKGDVMKMSPLTFGGFNADADGDALNYHVPVLQDAVNQAYDRMLPSRNLISPGDFKTPVHKPLEDYIAGLHAATAPSPNTKQRSMRFLDEKSAIAAYRRGEIPVNALVEIVK